MGLSSEMLLFKLLPFQPTLVEVWYGWESNALVIEESWVRPSDGVVSSGNDKNPPKLPNMRRGVPVICGSETDFKRLYTFFSYPFYILINDNFLKCKLGTHIRRACCMVICLSTF